MSYEHQTRHGGSNFGAPILRLVRRLRRYAQMGQPDFPGTPRFFFFNFVLFSVFIFFISVFILTKTMCLYLLGMVGISVGNQTLDVYCMRPQRHVYIYYALGADFLIPQLIRSIIYVYGGRGLLRFNACLHRK